MADLTHMQVFVPSRSRFGRSLTLEALDKQWERDRVALVVPVAQAGKYKALAARHKVRLLACPREGIAGTRQWIGQQAHGKFIMLDDDLRFYRRKNIDDWHLYQFGRYDMANMLTYVSRCLEHYAHVSISPRMFNAKYSTYTPPSGTKAEPHKYPMFTIGRPLRVLAYRKAPFLSVKHGRVSIMEDFDVTLQLLYKGWANLIITEYAQDQAQTQLPGGCSDYRTHKLHADNVHLMAKLHPGIVKVVHKKNKTGGEFGERVEAQIKWEKAYQKGLEDIL